MRLRAQSYQNLDGTFSTTRAIAWYWTLLAIVASTMILGGFLMLPVTFLSYTDSEAEFHVTSLAVGIFALAILLAGFCTTALACIVVHDLEYQAAQVFRPAMISCIVGFLTVIYNYIIFKHFKWQLPAILTIAGSVLGAAVYGLLLLWTHRKMNTRNVVPQSIPIQHHGDVTTDSGRSSRYQAPEYYQNYVKNMFPTAALAYDPSTVPKEPNQISEDEMQRQQMLMLLLKQDCTPNASSGNTFRIDWQAQEHETPIRARSRDDTLISDSSYSTHSTAAAKSLSVKVPGTLEPWDGVWRGVAQPPTADTQKYLERERRRRQIEQGM